MVKVSVVVPVYNPGPYLAPCVASVLGQSMPMGDLELVLVDDGSTDDTPAYLDALAAEHEHVRVFHEPASGWAGRPRNVGVRRARGEYVQLLDQDDLLGPEAMERMYATARRNRSDIVLGKVAGTMQVPNIVYLRNLDSCTIADGPVMDSLSPHKMFRRAFLREHELWHPEGRVRLEDQRFMIEAYLVASVISVVADYPCYYWMRRDDGGNASTLTRWTDPAELFGYVEELLSLMLERTVPGEFRDVLMRRTLRIEMLGKLSDGRVLTAPDAWVRSTFDHVRGLMRRYYGPPSTSLAGLAAVPRLRGELVRDGHLDDVVELGRRLRGDVRPRLRMVGRRIEGGVLHLRLRAELVHADGRPVVVVQRGGAYRLDPRWTDDLDGVGPHGWDVGDPLADVALQVRVVDDASQTHWFPPVRLEASLAPLSPEGARGDPTSTVVLDGECEIDPRTLGPGLPRGSYELRVSFQALGVGATTQLRNRRGRPSRMFVSASGRARPRRRRGRTAPPVSAPRRAMRAVARRMPRPVRAVVAAVASRISRPSARR